MGEHRDRVVEVTALGASVAVLLLVFLPWVRTGALQESDTVNGIDIPVIGWSSIVMCLVTASFAVAALALRNRWLWCAHTFAAALVVTGASLVLSTLDLLDSAVLGWVTEALPDSLESASPELSATFALWFTYSVAVLAVALGAWSVLRTSREAEARRQDLWIESPAEPPVWREDSKPLELPTWMREP